MINSLIDNLSFKLKDDDISNWKQRNIDSYYK